MPSAPEFLDRAQGRVYIRHEDHIKFGRIRESNLKSIEKSVRRRRYAPAALVHDYGMQDMYDGAMGSFWYHRWLYCGSMTLIVRVAWAGRLRTGIDHQRWTFRDERWYNLNPFDWKPPIKGKGKETFLDTGAICIKNF